MTMPRYSVQVFKYYYYQEYITVEAEDEKDAEIKAREQLNNTEITMDDLEFDSLSIDCITESEF
jgi:hypothetical protein